MSPAVRCLVSSYDVAGRIDPDSSSEDRAGDINRREFPIAEPESMVLSVRGNIVPSHFPGGIDPVYLGEGRSRHINKSEGPVAEQVSVSLHTEDFRIHTYDVAGRIDATGLLAD